MTSELLPCPFCGGEAEIERHGCTKFLTVYRCQDCGCSLETSETFNHGREWNARAVPAADPLTWRPDFHFGAKGGSPTMECAWTVWDRVPSNVTQYVPLLKPTGRAALAQGGGGE